MSRQPIPLLSLLVLVVAAPAAARVAAMEPIAHVVAIEGRATAVLPGEPARVLVCGDPVYADERLATEPGASLVLGREGRHAHLGPAGQLVLRADAAGGATLVLMHGDLRLLDANDLPISRVSTPLGPQPVATADFELHRVETGALELCEWSGPRQGRCQGIETSGQVRHFVQEGPRLDLGLGHACPWRPREGGLRALDFASTPQVASAPAGDLDPDFEDPSEPGCGGDECSLPPPDLEPNAVLYTVAPATPVLLDLP